MTSKKRNWAANPTNVIDVDFERAAASRRRQKEADEAERNWKREKNRKKLPAFFSTKEWAEVRYRVLKRDETNWRGQTTAQQEGMEG